MQAINGAALFGEYPLHFRHCNLQNGSHHCAAQVPELKTK
jgi:hypothetical protein